MVIFIEFTIFQMCMKVEHPWCILCFYFYFPPNVLCSLCFQGFMFLLFLFFPLLFIIVAERQSLPYRLSTVFLFEANNMVLIFSFLSLLFLFAYKFVLLHLWKFILTTVMNFRFGESNGACCKDSILVQKTWTIYCHLKVLKLWINIPRAWNLEWSHRSG